MLNPIIKVIDDSGIEGSGLVAEGFIPADAILYQFDDTNPPAHQYEMINWPLAERRLFLLYACQIGEDKFCFKQGNIQYINHSCDPSGWWLTYGVLTARRDIKPGEEITYDYSTSDIQLNYQMDCLCGSDSCRGVFTSEDYLKPDFQKKYAGHLPQHVVEAIHRAQANEPDPLGDTVPDDVATAVRQTLLRVSDFQQKYGSDGVFQMFRKTIIQVQSSDITPATGTEFRKKYDDKYIYDLVRREILKALRQQVSQGG